jgi:hypothetical protein
MTPVPLNRTRLKRLCGIATVLVSLILMGLFALSEAWFGVALTLFVGVVGAQIVFQPDALLRMGGPEDDVPRQ